MKAYTLSIIASLCLGALVVVSCAPAPPSVASSPTPSIPRAVAPLPATLREVTPQENAWAKVMETAKKEAKLTVYSFAFTGDVAIAIQRAFKDRYGIQVEIVAGSGAGLHERLKTERRAGGMVADVVQGSVTNKVNMKLDGLTAPYGELPALQEKGVWLLEPQVDAERHIVYNLPSILTNWINTNLVKPGQEPRSFRELADPKWKGKIIVYDPVSIQTVDQWYAVYAGRGILQEDYFVALGKQNIRRAYPAARAPELLSQGEGHVWLLGSQSTASAFVAQGAPIRPVEPEEGLAAFSQALSPIKDGPHPNAGQLFINWIVSREGQEVQNKAGQWKPIRTDMPDFSPPGARLKAEKLVVYTAQELEDGAKAFRERRVSKLWGISEK